MTDLSVVKLPVELDEFTCLSTYFGGRILELYFESFLSPEHGEEKLDKALILFERKQASTIPYFLNRQSCKAVNDLKFELLEGFSPNLRLQQSFGDLVSLMLNSDIRNTPTQAESAIKTLLEDAKFKASLLKVKGE